MKHYLFASLTIVALFLLTVWDAPAWLNLGIAGLLLTPLVFHVDELKRQIEVLEWSIEGSDELVSDLEAMIDRRNAEISEFHKSGVRFDEFLKADNARLSKQNASLSKENKELFHENKTLRDIGFQFDERFLKDAERIRLLTAQKEDLLEEVACIKKNLYFPKITPLTTDEQHFHLVRTAVEARLNWMESILTTEQNHAV